MIHHGEGKEKHLILKLEGMDAPIVGAVIRAHENSTVMASIEVPPAESILDLKPRTQVYVFMRNDKKQRRGEDEVAEYLTIFLGELVAISYAGSPSGRNAILQCVGHSSYWDACYQTMVDYGPNGNWFMGSMHVFLGSNRNLFDNLGVGNDPVTFLSEQLSMGVPRTPELKTISKGLLGGIIRILEMIGGIPSQFAGLNDFFTVAEMRTKVLQQVSAPENDKTPQRIMSYVAFKKLLTNSLSSAGGMWTFRQIINMLNQFIYHVTIPNPSPKYDPPGQKVLTSKAVSLIGDNVVKQLYSLTIQTLSNLDTALDSLKKLGEELSAYVLTQTEVSSLKGRQLPEPLTKDEIDIARVYWTTWLNVMPNIINNLVEIRVLLGMIREDYAKYLSSFNEATQQNFQVSGETLINSASSAPDYLKAGAHYILSALEALDPKSLEEKSETVKSFVAYQSSFLSLVTKAKVAVEAFKKLFKFQTSTKVSDSAARLHANIFCPDLWFVPPPRCNIIFPSQKTVFNYTRSFMSEISRLSMVSSPVIGFEVLSDKLLNSYYFAPPVELFKDIMKKTKNPFAYPVLLPHEIYTGIIPRMGHTAEFQRVMGDIQGSSQVKKLYNYSRRIANLQFFKFKFMSRQMSVNTRHDLMPVAGFPCAVVSYPQSELRYKGKVISTESALNLVYRGQGSEITGLPRQFIGKIMDKTLSISQGDGSCSYSIGYARDHRGSDMDWAAELSKTLERPAVKFENTFTKTLSYRELTPGTPDFELLKKASPVGSEKGVGELLKSSKGEIRYNSLYSWSKPKLKIGDELSEGTVLNIRYIRESSDNSERSVSLDKAFVSLEEVVSNGKCNALMVEDITNLAQNYPTYLPYLVEIDFKFEDSVKRDISLDEFIRPAWIDTNIYGTENISKQFYNPILGVDAITEGLSVSLEGAELIADPNITKVQSNLKQVTTEQALDVLALILHQLSLKAGYLESFIDNYTYRPIASMENILGSADLEYVVSGDTPSVKQGEEGFFSRAINPVLAEKGNLIGLTGGLTPMSGKSRKRIPKNIDPRPGCLEQVKKYLVELEYLRVGAKG